MDHAAPAEDAPRATLAGVHDETAVKTNLTRLRGRALVGERLCGTAPFGKWRTQTLIAGLTQNALIAPWVMNGLTFDIYVETQLAPVLDPGTGVILDNLSSHKSPRAAEALRRKGCWVFFLPPYSPDLNPPLSLIALQSTAGQ